MAVASGSELFLKGGIELQQKELPCEFKFDYLSMKLAWKFQLKNQLSTYPEISWIYPNINFCY